MAGILGALGAMMTFMGDQLITLNHLGGIRLKYYSIWLCLLMTGGFALMHDIECVGANMYKVSFCVYGLGYAWDDSVYGIGERALVHEYPEYFSEVRPYGTAVFTAEDLLDRSSWKLVSLVMDWDRWW